MEKKTLIVGKTRRKEGFHWGKGTYETVNDTSSVNMTIVLILESCCDVVEGEWVVNKIIIIKEVCTKGVDNT